VIAPAPRIHRVDTLRAEHYQAFAASLPHHSSLINSLTTSQVQIAEARTKLQEAKDAFSTKRADLVQLWSRGQTVEEMIKILDEMCVFPYISHGLP